MLDSIHWKNLDFVRSNYSTAIKKLNSLLNKVDPRLHCNVKGSFWKK